MREIQTQKLDITPDTAGQRLDVLVADAAGVSRARAQTLIKAGHVLGEGGAAKPNHRAKAGEGFFIHIPAPAPASAQPQDIPIDILYQDEDLAVINKPRGLVVHPAAGHRDGTLVNALLFRLNSLSGIGGQLRPGIVHRLDRDTSGLLLVAKNDAAHQKLSAALKARAIEKTYLALVEGVPKQDAGRIDAPIARHPIDRKRMAVVPGGRQAVSDYTVLERFQDAALVEVRIETGRTHQIRVHMAHIHHPLIGDPLYGRKKQKYALQGQALHAAALALAHPIDGRPLAFHAPLPVDMEHLLGVLRAQRRS